MRLRCALLLLFAYSTGWTQTPVKVSINWPPAALVNTKYGPIPKWAIFGEVIGCNQGTASITYGEGDVIAAIRSSLNLQAFSRQDAFLLVSNSQNDSKKNRITGWIRAGAKSAVDMKAFGLIGGSNLTGAAIVTTAELINVILPNAEGVLNLKQVIQYNTDGLQTTMAIPAGRCTAPASLLFAIPATPPNSAPNLTTFTLQVPADH